MLLVATGRGVGGTSCYCSKGVGGYVLVDVSRGVGATWWEVVPVRGVSPEVVGTVCVITRCEKLISINTLHAGARWSLT